MKLSAPSLPADRAFTLVEIAICLGIIGVALVAIIGILPIGMHTQRDSREETIVGQDASMLFEAVRSGSRGADDLTNHVYAIVNVWSNTVTHVVVRDCYTNQLAGKVGFPPVGFVADNWYFKLTNGMNTIGLMSTPEYVDTANNSQLANLYNGGISNHVVAYVSSISGVMSEQPPQDNEILRADTFGYRVYCVNAAVAVDSNTVALPYNRNLGQNLHELRMTFLWPLLPNGNTGKGRQTFRVAVAGQLSYLPTNSVPTYFYQPQSFTNAP